MFRTFNLMDKNYIFNCNIDDVFEKKLFSFEKKDDWVLPDVLVEGTQWSINSLDVLKTELNNTKSLLNDKGQDWHKHTAKINKASFVISAIKRIIQPEILTQAWCKFFEVLSNFSLISNNKTCIRSLHLCEAPGAFISALNYYLCVNYPSTSWEWTANSLNPYYEGHSIRDVVVDDRLLFPTLKHWYFGQDSTGDVTESNNMNDLCSTVRKTGLCDLITADGSVDCLENPGGQELTVEKLHFCEVLIALNCLLPSGCFVLKRFTFFECSSVSQLLLLNCVFEKVHVFKPFTSRPSNSEVYVICIGFQGSEVLANILQQFNDIYSGKNVVAVFPLSSIPESFIQQVEECMKLFTSLQMKAIKDNLMLYPLHDDSVLENLNNRKHEYAQAYIQKYSICSDPVYDSLKLFSKKRILNSFSNESKDLKSLYFEGVGDTFNNIRKSSSMQWLDKLLDVEKRINNCFSASRKRVYQKIEWQLPWKEIRSRMKSKNYQNWIACGKKVTCIRNSKFCYPILLHLWNKISHDSKVDLSSHMEPENCFYTDALESIFHEDDDLIKQSLGVISTSQNCNEKDSLLFHLKQNFKLKVSWCLNMDSDSKTKINMPSVNKILYINTSIWKNSLHNECMIKIDMIEALSCALENIKEGDTLFICVQSLLTRYMVALIFILISLFEKFTTVLPGESAPACMGQIWIFKNHHKNNWAYNALQYLKTIKEVKLSDGKEVLEIIPLASLCNNSFHAYLLDLNNKHLLQRLKTLIAVEKSKTMI